jgi:NitT/TauT family transport system substrate-binding protein
MRQRWLVVGLLAVAAALLAAGCGGSSKKSSSGGSNGGSSCKKTDNVTLQSKWVVQAQFAGYYAALDKGFYKKRCLNVTIKPGGPDITPEQVVACRACSRRATRAATSSTSPRSSPAAG